MKTNLAKNLDASRYLLPLITVVTILITTMIRVRFLEFPLERDEGEYAFMGSLILQGIAPFAESYNMKMPGIYAVYAVVMSVFGQDMAGIKVGLILFTVTSTYLVYLLGRQWISNAGGWIAAAIFSAMSISPSVQGLSANAEQFVLPFSLAGVFLLTIHKSRLRRIFLAGVLLGCGVVIKQHGIAFAMFGVIYVILIDEVNFTNRVKALVTLGLGGLLPLLLVLIIMAISGVFDTFWFWTVEYALAYVGQVSAFEGMQLLVAQILNMGNTAPWILIFTIVGLLGLFQKARWILGLFLLCSVLAIMPGFFFRPHYFIFLIPVLSLLTALGVMLMAHWLSDVLDADRKPYISNAITAALLVAIISSTLYSSRSILLFDSLETVSRKIYGANPFVESIEVAAYLKSHTTPDDRIAVVGSEPQIYFYAGRRAATGYIYTYALMEEQPFSSQMQSEMIKEIEAAAPRYLVFANVPNSWLVKPQSDRSIFSWYERYTKAHFELVGLVELNQTGGVYYWEEDLPENINPLTMGLFVYRRRDENR